MKNQSLPHVQIVQHPNPDRRSYHVTRQATKVHGFDFGIDSMSFLNDEKNPGLLAKRLAKALASIPGVTDGRIDGYEISIGKGSAFKWEEVSPLVIGQIVKRLFPKCEGNTIQISTTVNYKASYKDIAIRCEVPVSFGKKETWPQLDIEVLFTSATLTKVFDNTVSESTSPADGEGGASA